MVFSSLFFIFLFLPISLLLYYIIPSRTWKNGVLIVSSLVFYAWGEPVWVILLIISSIVDYFHGRIAERYFKRWQSKVALISSLVINLAILILFKYSGMFVSTFSTLFDIPLNFKGFSLPIGISFYTFQTISYVFDVYRGQVKAQKSFWKFLMFVSLFHQLVAGPIVRYKDISTEIENRFFSAEQFGDGVRRFAIGLAKKVIFANTAGALATNFLDGQLVELSMGGHWFGMTLFAFQIYYDFSGYSDMAIGLGRMFGFTYQENFNYPYISQSVTEFWRRWHMSLGSFFRDYLYIPLGGNRRYQFRNLFIVWFLTGLWHGASWNFVLWGLYYGVLSGFEKILRWIFKSFRLPAIFNYGYMFVVTIFGWTLFYFEDLNRGLQFMRGLINMEYLWDVTSEVMLMNNMWFLTLAFIGVTPIVTQLFGAIDVTMTKSLFRPIYLTLFYPLTIISIFIVAFVLLMGQSYNPFLYFRF